MILFGKFSLINSINPQTTCPFSAPAFPPCPSSDWCPGHMLGFLIFYVYGSHFARSGSITDTQMCSYPRTCFANLETMSTHKQLQSHTVSGYICKYRSMESDFQPNQGLRNNGISWFCCVEMCMCVTAYEELLAGGRKSWSKRKLSRKEICTERILDRLIHYFKYSLRIFWVGKAKIWGDGPSQDVFESPLSPNTTLVQKGGRTSEVSQQLSLEGCSSMGCWEGSLELLMPSYVALREHAYMEGRADSTCFFWKK